MIRRGWLDTAASVAPQLADLPGFLQDHLDAAEAAGDLSESSLLAVVDAAAQFAADHGAAQAAPTLTKRLRRTVYEYLLALDAITTEFGGSDSAFAASPSGGGQLIGAEEVASLASSREQPLPWPEPSPPVPPAEEPSTVGDPADATVTEVPAEATDGDASTLASNGRDTLGFNDPAIDAADDDEPSEKRRFALFRRGGGRPAEPEYAALLGISHRTESDWPPSPPQSRGAGAPPSPPPQAPLPAIPDGEPAIAPHADASATMPVTGESAVEAPFVAPRGGFHIANPEDLLSHAPVEAAPGESVPQLRPLPAPPLPPSSQWPAPAAMEPDSPPSADPSPGPAQPASRTGWRLRDHKPDPNVIPPEDDDHHDGLLDVDVDLTEARQRIDDRLRRKKCDEAGALLQQLAQDVGGRAVAELGLDAGDRCRALGKRMAATSCYLAASRADPLYEGPLSRLADICIDDHDIDLAVSYLERIARLTRLRGDTRGALRIYRKIVTIAPYREDILELLMRAQTTGRLEP